jgi:hypothetical protein
VGAAVAVGSAIAVALRPKRQLETADHPLKGSLNKRINLFSSLAKHTADPSARPPRRYEEADVYINADHVVV